MEWQGWLVVGLTVVVLFTLILTRIQPHIVMMAVLTVLSSTGILSASEAVAGFSNTGLITVAAMFVVAAGIYASGGVDLLVHHVLGQPKSERSALLRIFLPVVGLSAFLNNTPVVATMIPAINTWAKKIGVPASKLMIPLSYTAILGGTLTLIGTSTNLVINGQYQALTGSEGFGLFEIAFVGLPVALVGLAFIWLLFPLLLPAHRKEGLIHNLREFTLEVMVEEQGPLVGKTIVDAGLRNLERIYLVEVERDNVVLTAVSSDEVLQGGDRLIFAGDTEAISDLLRIKGIVAPEHLDAEDSLLTTRGGRRLVEVVVSPHCDVIGHGVRSGQFRARYGAVVLAVARNGERLKSNLGGIRLQAGDTLLLEARPAFITRQRFNKDFLLINELEETPPEHQKAWLSWSILLAAVTTASLGLTSMMNAALIASGLMIICGCCTVKQAEKSLDLMVIVTIAASFALGAALQKTGAAQFLAEGIVTLSAGDALILLFLTYLAVSILTELITNNAAAVLMLPIVLEVTQSAQLNPEPYVFAVMMAASASFATPLGYQTNLMVYGPGGYRFSDFLRVGIPMNLLAGVTTIAVLTLGWSLV